jgi:SAM-dependent methyltransferase
MGNPGPGTDRDGVIVDGPAVGELVRPIRCRHCHQALRDVVTDLGMQPLCESLLDAADLDRVEPHYPLVAYVCRQCWLMQVPDVVSPGDIFSHYAYFSSYSSTWVEHARQYVQAIVGRLGLGPRSTIVEVGSNDGYLLQHVAALGIPSLGIEPAANVAEAAVRKGIETRVEFFGEASAARLVDEGYSADLIVANNVLAQAPDLNDFVRGLKRLLAPGGTITIEVPHLLRLFAGTQFDTIYHEHFSYFSAMTARRVLGACDLELYDADEIATHGGSLRLYARHRGAGSVAVSPRVAALVDREHLAGFDTLAPYLAFDERVREIRRALQELIIPLRRRGRRLAAYGAPGKGNTLLNYCGIGRDFLEFTVDRNPYKQGRFLPGTHLPIFAPAHLFEHRPDYVLVLPWNLFDEIKSQLAAVASWGGRFIVPIPTPRIEA